jgi:hypothetical protein
MLAKQQELTFANDERVISEANPAFKQAAVNARLALHRDNLEYIQRTSPHNPIIPRLRDAIVRLEIMKRSLAPSRSSQEVQNGFYDMYRLNRTCAELLLNPRLPSVLSSLSSYERDSIALNFYREIFEVETAITTATSLATSVDPSERAVFNAELDKLRANLAGLKAKEDEILALSIRGTSENDARLVPAVKGSGINDVLKREILTQRANLSQENLDYLRGVGKPAASAASVEALTRLQRIIA